MPNDLMTNDELFVIWILLVIRHQGLVIFKIMKCKGVNIKGDCFTIKKKYGEEGFKKVLSALSEEDRKIVETCLYSDWLDFGVYRRFEEAIVKELGRGILSHDKLMRSQQNKQNKKATCPQTIRQAKINPFKILRSLHKTSSCLFLFLHMETVHSHDIAPIVCPAADFQKTIFNFINLPLESLAQSQA